MKRILFFLSIILFGLTSVANTLSDCIEDALERFISDYYCYYSKEVQIYVRCDNLPLDLLTRKFERLKFYDQLGLKFISNTKQMMSEFKEDEPIYKRDCGIVYTLSKNILTVRITPFHYKFKNNKIYSSLSDWYIYNYKYNFVSKQWIFDSKSIGGI